MTLARRPPPFASAALVVLLCAALPPACSSLPVVYRTKNGPGDGATRQHNASLMAYLRTFPNPRTQVRMCGGGGGAFRAGNAPVCDPSGTLTRRERAVINRLTATVCVQTTCPCRRCPDWCRGIRTGIAVLPDLDALFSLNDSVSVRDQIDIWAKEAWSRWWGDDQCTENILIVFVSIGQTLEITSYTSGTTKRLLTDQCIAAVHKQLRPLLRNADYGHAIATVVEYYGHILTGRFVCRPQFPYVMTTGVRIGIAFGAAGSPLLICVIVVFFGPCFGGRGFGGARHKTHVGTNYNSKYHRDEWETRWQPKRSATQQQTQTNTCGIPKNNSSRF